MTVKQADALVDWIARSCKNQTTIYITYGHEDHWFGIDALHDHLLLIDTDWIRRNSNGTYSISMECKELLK